jgi:hypothetical protein
MKISIFIVDRNIKISKESYLFLFLGPVLCRIRMRTHPDENLDFHRGPKYKNK